MKYNSGQKFILFLVLIVALIVGWSLLKTKSQIASLKTSKTEDQAEKSLKKVQVTAKNGQFKPDEIEVPLSSTITLEVNAIDGDYIFQLKDFGINKKLPKGKKTQVKIDGLGVGKYRFNCGQDCGGIVEVVGKSDEEED